MCSPQLLGVTVGPGVGIAILIVGLLFLSPVAAIIPILMGGLSIAIALPAIYFGIVVIGHGSITFLTPTLTTLLMLGLAVDYAVLQSPKNQRRKRARQEYRGKCWNFGQVGRTSCTYGWNHCDCRIHCDGRCECSSIQQCRNRHRARCLDSPCCFPNLTPSSGDFPWR